MSDTCPPASVASSRFTFQRAAPAAGTGRPRTQVKPAVSIEQKANIVNTRLSREASRFVRREHPRRAGESCAAAFAARRQPRALSQFAAAARGRRPLAPARRIAMYPRSCGRVPEWSNGPDSKSGVRLSCTVGSNPTPSAIDPEHTAGKTSQFVGEMKGANAKSWPAPGPVREQNRSHATRAVCDRK
jgi:hypothetical protein